MDHLELHATVKPQTMMTEGTTGAIARTAHEGQQASAGHSLLNHLRRIAAAVPEYARVTAWLHPGISSRRAPRTTP